MIIYYDKKKYEVDDNITAEEFVQKNEIKTNYTTCLVLINNEIRELTRTLKDNDEISFLDLTVKEARDAYMRTLSFIFISALKKTNPSAKCTIEHSLSNGIYCYIDNGRQVNRAVVSKIYEKMKEIVKEDIKIKKLEFTKSEARKIYIEENFDVKLGLLDYKDDKKKVTLYELCGQKDYFYGYMLPSTGYAKIFNLRLCNGGIVLLGPDIKRPDRVSEFKHEPRLFSVYAEAKSWGKAISIENVLDLNNSVKDNSYHDLIRYAEGYHEKKICEIADAICRENKKIILISGPSSSGKTSFANRLKIQLFASKKRPISISMDNYFIDRDKIPVDKDGKKDFESLRALDVERFNDDLDMLISGEEVKLPTFDFLTGKRKDETNTVPTKIDDDQPIIIEGIHGLNPALTESLSSAYKYKIYVSALTGLNIDSHNKISTTDIRLMRRIIRDNSHRGYDAENTMSMWASVGEGERKNIFVFQENADIMFNSALIYEIAVIKKHIEALLKKIGKDSKYFNEAKRLLKFLKYFASIDDESDIPNTSILREFIGGSKLVD
ncbi:phosphoribulokinase/Uridine kinase family protein [Peptostreptococcaceae bacterium AS15]|nr:phosphoribulokinase/Uridine kinase family protein [Peptostreptococcaceae bacterium AS15]